MPKNIFTTEVERIAIKISRREIITHKQIKKMAVCIKELQDDRSALLERLRLLEIRLKKVNDYGAMPVPQTEADPPVESSRKRRPRRIAVAQLKKNRERMNLSQAEFAKLLGVQPVNYGRWENGKAVMVPAIEQKARELHNMKGSELRVKMHEAGIFMPTGRKRKSSNPVSDFERPSQGRHEAKTLTSSELRAGRKALQMTQAKFAAMLGIKTGRYVCWENDLAKTPGEFAKAILKLWAEHSYHPQANSVNGEECK